MATVRDLLKGSMRLIGAIATGETPSSDELADGLTALNGMIESWSTEKLIVPEVVIEKFDLIPSQQLYTMGTSGDFNTTRPLFIERAGLELQSATPKYEMSLEIINLDQWADISQKESSSTLPCRLYVIDSYPLKKLYLWPVPAEAHKIVLYSQKALTSFASVNTTISLPPGYERALRYNLAIEIAPEFGKEPSVRVENIANKSLGNIKRINSKPKYLVSDAYGLNERKTFNIWTGEGG